MLGSHVQGLYTLRESCYSHSYDEGPPTQETKDVKTIELEERELLDEANELGVRVRHGNRRTTQARRHATRMTEDDQ